MCAFGNVVGIKSNKKKRFDVKICTNDDVPANSMSSSKRCSIKKKRRKKYISK